MRTVTDNPAGVNLSMVISMTHGDNDDLTPFADVIIFWRTFYLLTLDNLLIRLPPRGHLNRMWLILSVSEGIKRQLL